MTFCSNKKVLGNHTYFVAHCPGSSIDWALACIDQSEDGAVFKANSYGFARGRQGRVWQLQEGQLILTFILKPKIITGDANTILNFVVMAVVNGIIEGLESFVSNLKIFLKWPNDFYCCGKKVGGILSKPVWQSGKLKGIIFGVGINVNNKINPSSKLFDIATSLAQSTGKNAEIAKLERSIFSKISVWNSKWKENKTDQIFEFFSARQFLIGKRVILHQNNRKEICGILKEVCSNGDVILEQKSEIQTRLRFSAVNISE